MNEIVEQEHIEGIIYEIRGVQVMLDSDLARLYECKNGTKEVNQAVRRNMNKFPDRYRFQLTQEEYDTICSSRLETKTNKLRVLPYVYTEQGVAMLATILKTPVADVVSMRIIDAFVYMRRYLSYQNKNTIILNHEKRILKLEESFDKFSSKQNTIIYDGKIYDAYSTLLDIFNDSKKEVIIIDNYANKELFDILRNIDRKIIVISKNLDDVLIKKYNNQYSNIVFVNNDFFMIDTLF